MKEILERVAEVFIELCLSIGFVTTAIVNGLKIETLYEWETNRFIWFVIDRYILDWLFAMFFMIIATIKLSRFMLEKKMEKKDENQL